MIKVSVKVHQILKQFLSENKKGNTFDVILKDNPTVKDLINIIFIFPDEYPNIILINGIMGNEKHILKRGDKISFYSRISGG